MSTVVERFLRYVNYETTSNEASETCPSTPGQKVLGAKLVEEMKEMGIADARMDENGYVFGTVPGDLNLPIIVLPAIILGGHKISKKYLRKNRIDAPGVDM